MMVVAMAMFAQSAVITFSKSEHDFGKINEADGKVTTIFEFKNEGMEPLVLSNVKASCGCTTPQWTKTPIEPGQTGSISVTYNPVGRPGKFQKTITVTSNSSDSPKKLYIKGEVIPKPAKPTNRYTVKMGDLSLNAKTVNFGTMMNTANMTRTLDYANLTDHEITIEVFEDEMLMGFLSVATTSEKIKPGEAGQLRINLDAKKAKQWGQKQYELYVRVNGKTIKTEEYMVKVHVNFEEDFSTMTAEDKMQAPIAELSTIELKLGTVGKDKKVKQSLNLKNAGVNPLYIRNISNPSPDFITITNSAKGALKNGKKATISVEVSTKGQEPGNYRREIVIMTNDPQHSKIKCVVSWSVE